jgi:hypothetical protein
MLDAQRSFMSKFVNSPYRLASKGHDNPWMSEKSWAEASPETKLKQLIMFLHQSLIFKERIKA